MSAPAHPVHLCGRPLETARHTCVFFNSRDEEYSIAAPFVKEGLEQGEQVVMIVAGSQLADHAARLARAGVDTAKPTEEGRYTTFTSEDAYLSDGAFDPERTLKTLHSLLAERERRGFPQLRVTGNMEWALSGKPGTEKLLEYEAGVTQVSRQHRDPFVCFYDVNQFDAPTLIDIMRTHPAIVIGGVYHENPFFVAPEEMLRELAERKGTGTR